MRLATLSATLATAAALVWMMSFSVRPGDSLFFQPPSHAQTQSTTGLLTPARHG